MTRWNIEKKQDLLIILFVFSITGSTSVMIGRPLLAFLGLTRDNLSLWLYYPLLVFFSFVFYQVFLVFFGWIFGQFQFFWAMEKKMLRRFGVTL